MERFVPAAGFMRFVGTNSWASLSGAPEDATFSIPNPEAWRQAMDRKELVEALFEEFDENGDGAISRREFK